MAKRKCVIRSKAQAGLFGAVAGGKQTQAKSLTPAQAKKCLRGTKVKNLPYKVATKK